MVESWYTVNENGVSVGDKTQPWINKAAATPLLPAIVEKAKKRCEQVLSLQATLKTVNKSPSTTGFQVGGLMAEKTCAPVLQAMCASPNRDARKLSNGDDIAMLCR